MKQYTIINTYTIAEGQQVETCEHCGRAIKNVVVIHDNVNNVDLRVGNTCIIKIMKLNENFNKALLKAIKSYNKSIEEKKQYIDYTIEDVKNDYVTALKNDGLNQWNWRESKQGYTKTQLYYECAINVWYALNDIDKYIDKLNGVSKTGLVELNSEDIKEKIKFWDSYLNEIKANKYYPEV